MTEEIINQFSTQSHRYLNLTIFFRFIYLLSFSFFRKEKIFTLFNMNVNRKICMSFGNTRFMLIDNNLMHNVLDIEKTIILSFLLGLLILDGLYLQCNVIQCGLSYNVVILDGGIGKESHHQVIYYS